MRPITEMDEETRLEWEQWLAERPNSVKALATKLPPWFLYELTTTGQKVQIQAYAEDGTVRVLVLERWNGPMLFERSVFGIDPETLKPCEPVEAFS